MTQERAERIAWIVGGVGLAVALLGWLITPAAFPYAWLAALTAWIGWPLGCLALILIHALTGGRWGDTIRPELFTGLSCLPLLLPALIPLLCVLPPLYPWLRHDEAAASLGNHFYLNMPFATARGLLYLAVWFGLGALTLRGLRRRLVPQGLAAPGLILLGLTVTFAAVDATMSLEPHFHSSNFGMIAAAEAGLFALAVCVFGATFDPTLEGDALADLGQLLITLLILWAYLDFMQVLIIWQSDLPHEADWYVRRLRGGWVVAAAIVTAGHFLLPLFALFSPRVRRSRRALMAIAALLIAMQVPRAWWLVLPAGNRSVGWVDIAAMLAMGGLSAALALRVPRPAAFARAHHE